MDYINVFGLVFMIIIMIPNVIFARKHPEGFENHIQNKVIEVLEQIGRFSCFGLMVVVFPKCGYGFVSKERFVLYLLIDMVLIVSYIVIWIVCFQKNSRFRSLALSILPSLLFLLSGVISQYIPLVIAALLFAPCHIWISYKNRKLEEWKDE